MSLHCMPLHTMSIVGYTGCSLDFIAENLGSSPSLLHSVVELDKSLYSELNG